MFGKKKPKPEEAEATETDAPEGDGAEGEVAEGKKKLPLKLLLMGAAGALVVLGGGGTAAYMFLAPKGDKAEAHGEKPKKKEKKEKGGKDKGKPAPGAAVIREGPDGVTFYTLPDIVVNMQTADGRPTFLKLKLTFELPDQETADILTPAMPRLTDMFQTFLRELRPEDLSGSQGSFQLRQEIQRRVNLTMAPAHVNAVLIEEMLIN